MSPMNHRSSGFARRSVSNIDIIQTLENHDGYIIKLLSTKVNGKIRKESAGMILITEDSWKSDV